MTALNEQTATEFLNSLSDEQLDKLGADAIDELLYLVEAEARTLRYDWQANCLPYQRLPHNISDCPWVSREYGAGKAGNDDFNTIAWICGRGAGKTRTAVENIRAMVERGERRSIGIVAPTEKNYRDNVVDPLLACSPPHFMPRYHENHSQVVWPNGAVAYLCHATNEDLIRGYNWDLLYCDEVVAWKRPETYNRAKDATRLVTNGRNPLTIVTTTPKSSPLVWSIVRARGTASINASSLDNPNLPKSYLDDLYDRYYGTNDWDYEVLGKLRESIDGALWTPQTISDNRIDSIPDLTRICVGVDPGGFGDNGDETGIVVAGIGVDGLYYILADNSLQAAPDVVAKKIVATYNDDELSVGSVIYEKNQGGNWIKALLSTVQSDLNLKAVHASKGKLTRAEPIASLYAQGKVKHVGEFPSLEKQMCEYVPGVKKSPDRMDALVWVMTELSGKSRELKVF